MCKVSPSYYDLLGRTRKIIEQKNACLKSFRGRFDKSRENELEYWDFSLAELSAEMIIDRYRYCRMVSDKAAAHHSVISDGKEVLKVEYSTISGSEGVIRGILTTDDMFDLFIQGTLSETILARIRSTLSDFILDKLRKERISDVEKGVYTNGVHRDDLEITLNDLSMRQFSSQGQQRSASLSLKLA
jgi:DNA replication and repair protein RecF